MRGQGLQKADTPFQQRGAPVMKGVKFPWNVACSNGVSEGVRKADLQPSLQAVVSAVQTIEFVLAMHHGWNRPVWIVLGRMCWVLMSCTHISTAIEIALLGLSYEKCAGC